MNHNKTVIRVHQPMTFQFICCTETFGQSQHTCGFIPSCQCMSLYVTILFEFLTTNVTSEPSVFIVWLQQMSLQLFKPCKTIWTVPTGVRLCTSVSTNMLLQFTVYCKQLRRVMTVVMVFYCCVQDVYVSASCWSCWNLCYKVNTCMVCLQCGLSCEGLDFQTD